MVGLLNTSSCAPASLEIGDSKEIVQVDALLLMSGMSFVGQLGSPMQLNLLDISQVDIVPSSISYIFSWIFLLCFIFLFASLIQML
jgi:hypothetical protein